ncbi:HhH-GPD-type base excision DNA repair protein [Kitasatospora sp. NPDC089797]|uniref:HhH-GPD-type base excision DNA repair protein n=1 Tax=Kitasatospora sp. NPDC089797 TaxID=3155298 RepID=UPI003445E6AE
MDHTVCIAQQPEADALLSRSALALLTGALLDRHIPSEWAFAGPLTIARRLGWDDLDAQQIADHSPPDFAAVLAARPAVHTCPALMARHLQDMCRFLVARYDGRAATVWERAATGRQLFLRVNELPGFGRRKAQILVALLGKQYGVCPPGWREAAGPFGESGVFRSVADVTGPESLRHVRETRQEERRTAKDQGLRASRTTTSRSGPARPLA